MTIEIMRTTSAAAPSDVGGLADAVLVDLARQGREDAIRTLIQRHNRRLFRVARGIVRDDAEAEDIVQETYVRAFTHLTSFRGAAELATWLTRIAMNEALGRLRRRRPRADLTELEAVGADDTRVIPFPTAPAGPEAETSRARCSRVLAVSGRIPSCAGMADRVVLRLRRDAANPEA